MLRGCTLVAGLALFLSAVVPAVAQEEDTGVGQIAGFLGAIAGVGGGHVNGGVNFASPTTRHLVPNVEFAYSPLDATGYRKIADLNTQSVLSRARLYDLNGGLRVRFPGQSNTVPYVGVGIGLIHLSADLESVLGVNQPVNVHTSSTFFAANVSAGFNYYLTDHLGVTPEIKGYFGHHKFVRIAVAVFYQFP